MGEEPTHDVPATEMGGDDGLIQPRKPELLRGDPLASGGHVLDGQAGNREQISDADGVVRRAGMRPLSVAEQLTGVEDGAWVTKAGEEGMGADALVDPYTGRAASGEINKAGGVPGELSDLKP